MTDEMMFELYAKLWFSGTAIMIVIFVSRMILDVGKDNPQGPTLFDKALLWLLLGTLLCGLLATVWFM